jgi:hypothetical protein
LPVRSSPWLTWPPSCSCTKPSLPKAGYRLAHHPG